MNSLDRALNHDRIKEVYINFTEWCAARYISAVTGELMDMDEYRRIFVEKSAEKVMAKFKKANLNK